MALMITNRAKHGSQLAYGDHWSAQGVDHCARDLPVLEPTRGATVIRVVPSRLDGQGLAGSGALTWEGEAWEGESIARH